MLKNPVRVNKIPQKQSARLGYLTYFIAQCIGKKPLESGSSAPEARDLVTKKMEKVEILTDFFAFIFTGKVYSQARRVAEPCDRGCGNETLPRAAGERDREYLSKLNIHLWEQMWC